jgi:hypothetical protein
MNTSFIRMLGALALTLSCTVAAADPTPVADWRFDEAAGRTLNLSANTGSGVGGAGGTWDVAVGGVLTTGLGTLNVRNTGAGGSGTRTTYADFGPYPGSVSSGAWALYATFSSWDFSGAGASGPRFTLALIEGNDFTTAQFTLAGTAAGVTLGAGVDLSGDGANLAGQASFAAAVSQPLTVRLTVDLDTDRYALAYDSGSGWVALGTAAIDSQTAGMNSLRLSLDGDFTVGNQAGHGLVVDRIWVSAVPEPGSVPMAAVGLLALAAFMHRRSGRQGGPA